MTQELRQGTATTVKVGPIVSSADGSKQGALTLVAGDVKIAKTGGAIAARNDTNAPTADGTTGYYDSALNATDVNTAGRLSVVYEKSGSLLWRGTFRVLPAAVYDAKYAPVLPHAGLSQTGGNTTAIKLAAAASATDDVYNGFKILLTYVDGTDAHAQVIDYDGTTKIATLDRTLPDMNNATTHYDLLAG